MDKSVAKYIQNLSRRKNDSRSEVGSMEDVLADILLRLPVKSLLSFKIVTKFWYRLICSPTFTKLHFSRSRENTIYIVYPYLNDKRVLHLVDADGALTKTITLPNYENMTYLRMICSYNGLICFTNHPWYPHRYKFEGLKEDMEIQICNPATREVHFLPRRSPSEVELGLGVAFGPGMSDYRVFRFFSSEFDKVRPQCEIFSSSTGSWRGIGLVEHSPMGTSHIFLNGKVYWFVASKDDEYTPGGILSVDMIDTFRIVELPNEVTQHSFLIDLEGCLSLVLVYDDIEIMDVWSLKDENESRWEKKCSAYIRHNTSECIDSVAAIKDEFFFITTDHYFIFNTKKATWRKLYYGDGFAEYTPLVFTYRPSLLPCS